MASIVFGDYEYTTITNGVKFRVINRKQTSYSDVLEFVTIDNIKYPVISAEEAFYGCSNLIQAPILPDSITNMTRAFYNCTNLISIDRIPLSVENMTYCFRGCEKLKYIRDALHNVVNLTGCFDGCLALERSPEIPESALYLNWTFYNCTGISQTIIIHSLPNSYTSVFGEVSSENGPHDIAIATISNNSAVASFWRDYLSTYAASRNLVMWGDGGYCPILLVGDYFYEYRDDIRGFSVWVSSKEYNARNDRSTFGDIPETLPICFDSIYVKNIQDCFYNEENLMYAPALPNSIESMARCFYNCRSLVSVTMPTNVTNIDRCFNNCFSLQFISLPNSIEYMHSAFSYCTSLKTVNIPTNVIQLGYCFLGCSNLCCDLTIPESAYGSLNGTFQGCKNLSGNLTIECNINSNNDRIFYNAVTSGQLYIINNARQEIKDSAARNWRSVVQNHNNPNIHYETDDHLAPTAQLELKRTDSQGNESSTGDHILIKKTYTIYSNDIPSGFPISVQRETTTINGKPCTTPSGSPVIYNVVKIGDEKATVEYTISDNYKTTTITATLSKVMALIDFLGSGSQRKYADIPGMGIAIGRPATRNGLDIQFPTAIGTGLTPATKFKYDPVEDPIGNPSGQGWYEKVSEEEYILTEDTTVIGEKTYYTQRENSEYVDLENAQLIVGNYNIPVPESVFIIGNGTENEPSNSLWIKSNGSLVLRNSDYADGVGGKNTELTFLDKNNEQLGFLKAYAEEYNNKLYEGMVFGANVKGLHNTLRLMRASDGEYYVNLNGSYKGVSSNIGEAWRLALGLGSLTTPSISISTTTGTLANSSVRQYGKVIQLSLRIQKSSVTPPGQNVYEGTITTTGLRPTMTTTGATYYQQQALIGTISSSGAIVVRNASSTQQPAITGTTGANISFTYLVK